MQPSADANQATVGVPAGEAGGETPLQPKEPPKRLPLVWIPAILGLGLLTAAVYLGARILTAKSDAAAVVHSVGAPSTIAALPDPVGAQKAPENINVVPAAKGASQAQEVGKHTPLAELQAKPEEPSHPDGTPAAELDGDLALITPATGELYIQIGALGPKATRKYIRELKDANFNPHVAPGPSPDLLRILVGPFTDKDALSGLQSRIEAQGIPNFIRKY